MTASRPFRRGRTLRCMLRRAVILLAACSPDPANRPPPTDAVMVDEYDECVTGLAFTQTAIEGTTPIGFFAGLDYAVLSFEGGFCGGRYVATFMEQPSACHRGRSLRLSFRAYDDDGIVLRSAGEIVPANASYTGVASAHTGVRPEVYSEQVEFRISHLAPPDDAVPRVRGRFVSTPGSDWTFDVYIDLVSAYSSNCI